MEAESWCTWWRYQMETFSALLAIYVGNSPVTGEFPAQRPVTRSFEVFVDLRLNKRSWGWWVNNREAGDFGRHRAHYDVIVMFVEIIVHALFVYCRYHRFHHTASYLHAVIKCMNSLSWIFNLEKKLIANFRISTWNNHDIQTSMEFIQLVLMGVILLYVYSYTHTSCNVKLLHIPLLRADRYMHHHGKISENEVW